MRPSTPRTLLRLTVQVPVYKDLNGDQRELAVVNVGLTYLF